MNTSELGGPILKAVSRSFYLTIRVLPRKLRDPIGLAYLLARASDTIADSPAVPTSVRIRHLAAFAELVQTSSSHGLTELQQEIRPAHVGECALISRLDVCLTWLRALSEADQAEIRAVMAKIIHGQTLDLRRFSEIEASASVHALQSGAELEEYTYLVAGCVGEFWTRVSVQHLPNYSRCPLPKLTKLGIEYGKALQLVNILRDLPADLGNGRCYLPADELTAASTAPDQLMIDPAPARPVFTRWLNRADYLMESGRQYLRVIRPPRLRIACYLPWFLGSRTLEILKQQPSLEASSRLKVSRKVVRSALLRAPLVAWSNLPIGPQRVSSGDPSSKV